MRIWISNTVENQLWQTTIDNEAFDFGDSSQATYRVKIEGRLLEDDDDDDIAENTKENADPMAAEEGSSSKEQKKPAVPQRTRLSHFFKQIIIEYDRNPSLQPDQMTQIEWKKPESRDARNNKSPQLLRRSQLRLSRIRTQGRRKRQHHHQPRSRRLSTAIPPQSVARRPPRLRRVRPR